MPEQQAATAEAGTEQRQPPSEESSAPKDVILAKNDFPYRTQEAAALQLRNLGLTGTHQVVPYKTGFALARIGLSPEPEPRAKTVATTRPDAYKYVEVLPSEFRLCPLCGLKVKKSDSEDADPCPNSQKTPPCRGRLGQDITKIKEHYFFVQFENKSHDYEPDDVTLLCNCDALTFQRGKPVPVPGRFLEAARHGQQIKWKKDPGKGIKRRAPIQTFPFTELRECTKEEYEVAVREGTAKTRHDVEMYGDGRPE